MTSPAVHLASLIFGIIVLRLLRKKLGRSLPYPPGPKGWPIIGNALQVPISRSWIGYTEWGKTYNSDLLHADALGQHILVINNVNDALELLDKRASIYSDRPELPLLKMMGWKFNSGLMRYGETWRQHRKVLQQGFRKDVLEPYRDLIEERCQVFLRNIATKPEEFMDHCKLFAAAVITSIVYGYDINSLEDPFYVLAEEAIDSGSRALLPGAFAVNIFPVLRHVPRWAPGGAFHAFAEKCEKITTRMMEEPFALVKDGMAKSVDKKSLVRELLEKNQSGGQEGDEQFEYVVKSTAATSFAAGVDTTSSSFKTLFLVLATHPDVQKRAKEEILHVVGNRRLPAFADRPSLPYLEAVFRELMRWRPPVPLGVPHAVIQDDVYKGYMMPKGSIVIANIWAMTRNEEVYPDPETFRPERFLNVDGSINDDDRILAFGFGRRVCTGRYLAADSVWLGLAHILATFSVSNPKAVSGEELDVSNIKYTDEGITHPEPFACKIELDEGANGLLAL